MPIPLTLLERLGILQLNEGPAPMLDLAAALATKAVLTALRLGLLEALEGGARTADDLADHCGAPVTGVRHLLDALAATGYLRAEADRYALTPMSRTWLLASSPRCMADLFPQIEDTLARWDDLEASIRGGRPVQLGWQWLDAHDGAWERYHAGLRAVARMVGPEVVRRTRLRGEPRRLLDIGGSHALYSVLFCQAHAGLEATVLDWPCARATAEDTIVAAGMADRVRFLEGALESVVVDADFDVALAFNFLRIFDSERLPIVLSQIRDRMAVGGRLVILDEFGGAPAGSFAHANHELIRLELFNATVGRQHLPDELRGPLETAGFSRVTSTRLTRAGGLGLVTAVRR